jgi:hypothetical protein
MTEDRDAKVLELRASGKSAREVAAEFGLTVPEVEAIVKAQVDLLQSGEGLRQSVGLALYRLEKMEVHFHNLAMQDDDATCAAISLKANERRATLSGSNAPIGHSVRMIGDAGPSEETSTDQLFRAIKELRESGPPAEPN